MSMKQPPSRPDKPRASRPRPDSARRDHPRRPGRSSNQGTVKTQTRDRASFSLGGLTISVQALAVFLVVGLVALVLIPTALQWSEQKRAYRAINVEAAAADARIDELQQQLDNWSNDEFVASQARSRLGYVKKGETQFSVVDAPAAKQQVVAVAKESEQLAKPWTLNLVESLQQLDNPAPSKGAAGE